MKRSRAILVIVTAIAVLGLSAVAGCEETTAPTTTTSGPTVPSGTTPAETSSSTSGAVAAITPGEVIDQVVAVGLYAPESQITVFDYATFADWAGAYVWVEEQDVHLVVLRQQGGDWTVVDTITGLDWVETQARLRALGAPEDLITWSNPEGD